MKVRAMVIAIMLVSLLYAPLFVPTNSTFPIIAPLMIVRGEATNETYNDTIEPEINPEFNFSMPEINIPPEVITLLSATCIILFILIFVALIYIITGIYRNYKEGKYYASMTKFNKK